MLSWLERLGRNVALLAATVVIEGRVHSALPSERLAIAMGQLLGARQGVAIEADVCDANCIKPLAGGSGPLAVPPRGARRRIPSALVITGIRVTARIRGHGVA